MAAWSPTRGDRGLPRASSPSTSPARSRCSPEPAGRPAPRSRRAATTCPVVSADGGPVDDRERVGLGHLIPSRSGRARSTRWCCPAGAGSGRPRMTPRWSPWVGGGAPPGPDGWPPCARARSWRPTPACSTAAGSPPTGPVAEQLAAELPRVEVDADPIYIADGKFWTSAGVTAGIDLALALVEDDLGIDVAQTDRPVAGDVPPPPGGTDPVRLAGVGAPGRAFRRAGRPDPGGGGPGWRPPASRPWPRPRP